jgi:hypothetical protein
MRQTGKKMVPELRLQENQSFKFKSQRACLPYRHEMKQHCRIFVHIINLWFTNRQEKLNFVNWYLHAIHAEEIDPTLFLFSVED